jgi:hypothetical protein
VKFRKGNRPANNAQRPLDTVSPKSPSDGTKAKRRVGLVSVRGPYSTKKPRGRPQKIPRNWVTGRAYNYGIQLSQLWPSLEAPLLAAHTEKEVTAAFEDHGKPYAQNFVPGLAADILAIIRDPKFPKRSEARVSFLADSLGGRPDLSFRSSRDICEKERAKQRRKSEHHIIRHEYYVECSCGYKGPARENACRRCGAEISRLPEMLLGAHFG